MDFVNSSSGAYAEKDKYLLKARVHRETVKKRKLIAKYAECISGVKPRGD